MAVFKKRVAVTSLSQRAKKRKTRKGKKRKASKKQLAALARGRATLAAKRKGKKRKSSKRKTKKTKTKKRAAVAYKAPTKRRKKKSKKTRRKARSSPQLSLNFKRKRPKQLGLDFSAATKPQIKALQQAVQTGLIDFTGPTTNFHGLPRHPIRNPIHFPHTKRGRPSKQKYWICDLYTKTKVITFIAKSSRSEAERDAMRTLVKYKGEKVLLSGPYNTQPTAETKRK